MAPRTESESQQIWRVMSALQAHQGSFSQRLVVDILGPRQRRAVEAYLAFLVAEKVVAVTRGSTPTAPLTYSIVNTGEAPPDRRGLHGGTARQQALWTAIRGLRSFSVPELALSASTEELPIGLQLAVEYVQHLARAGYLRETGTLPRQRQTKLYALVVARNTGPRAPILHRSEPAFDLNLMRSVNLNGSVGRAA
jgi:hypothetical protein